jgi:hypothetical protein
MKHAQADASIPGHHADERALGGGELIADSKKPCYRNFSGRRPKRLSRARIGGARIRSRRRRLYLARVSVQRVEDIMQTMPRRRQGMVC